MNLGHCFYLSVIAKGILNKAVVTYLLFTSLPSFLQVFFCFCFFNYKSFGGFLLKMPFTPVDSIFKELDWHCFSLWIKERWSVTKAWSLVGSGEFWTCVRTDFQNIAVYNCVLGGGFGSKIYVSNVELLKVLWGSG